MNPLITWKEKIESYELPRWHELPELTLYLDQVLEYIHEILMPIFIEADQNEPFLTAAMINNYVKHGHLPAPVKKRYSRTHLAFIISITVLKQVTNLNNVSVGTRNLTKQLGKEKAYNTFVEYLEVALRSIVAENKDNEPNRTTLFETEAHLLPLKTITLAFTSKMLAEYLFSYMIKEEKEEKKENEK